MTSEFESFRSDLDELTRREELMRAAMAKVAGTLVNSGFPKACAFRPEGAGFIARFIFDNHRDSETGEEMREEIELSLRQELGKAGMTISGINRVTVHFECRK